MFSFILVLGIGLFLAILLHNLQKRLQNKTNEANLYEQLKQRLFALAIYQIGYEDGEAKSPKRSWNLEEITIDENELLNLQNFYKKGYEDAETNEPNNSERSIWYVFSKKQLSDNEWYKFNQLFEAAKQMFLSLDKS